MQSLRLNPDARVIALAASTLRVSTGVAAADRSRIQAPAPQPAGNLRLIVNGVIEPNTSVTLGTDVQLRALVIARNVFRSADRLTRRRRHFRATVTFGNDAQLAFNTGFGCATAADCNDNSTCTTDSCVNALCVNAPVANGTACSDGNGLHADGTYLPGGRCAGGPIVCPRPISATTTAPAIGRQARVGSDKPDGTACDDSQWCARRLTLASPAFAGERRLRRHRILHRPHATQFRSFRDRWVGCGSSHERPCRMPSMARLRASRRQAS